MPCFFHTGSAPVSFPHSQRGIIGRHKLTLNRARSVGYALRPSWWRPWTLILALTDHVMYLLVGGLMVSGSPIPVARCDQASPTQAATENATICVVSPWWRTFTH